MDHFAGLDVSIKETSICVVDDTGRIMREVKVASEPEALLQVLTNPTYHFKRIGLEAGPLSQWLFSALACQSARRVHLPVVCIDQQRNFDDEVRRLAKSDEVTRRLMTVPGVGVVTALTFRHTIDDPSRFHSASSVGAYRCPAGPALQCGFFATSIALDLFELARSIANATARLHCRGRRNGLAACREGAAALPITVSYGPAGRSARDSPSNQGSRETRGPYCPLDSGSAPAPRA